MYIFVDVQIVCVSNDDCRLLDICDDIERMVKRDKVENEWRKLRGHGATRHCVHVHWYQYLCLPVNHVKVVWFVVGFYRGELKRSFCHIHSRTVADLRGRVSYSVGAVRWAREKRNWAFCKISTSLVRTSNKNDSSMVLFPLSSNFCSLYA